MLLVIHIRRLLLFSAYQVGTPIDMYNAFRRSLSEDRTFEYRYPGIDIESVFDSWVQNRGSPVLNVELNENNGVVSIDQVSRCTRITTVWRD